MGPVRTMGQRLSRLVAWCAFGLLAATAVVACGAEQLDPALRDSTSVELRSRASDAGIVIDPSVASCAVDHFDEATATDMIEAGQAEAELRRDVADAAADALVSCDHDSRLGAEVVAPLAPGATTESLNCVADQLGDERLVALLASELSGDGDPTEFLGDAEAMPLVAGCLSPEELLGYLE